MKYKPDIYAKALVDALSENKEAEARVLKSFLRAVKKNGDWVGISKILRAVEANLVKSRGGRMVLVESARELPGNVVGKFLGKFQKEDKVEFARNEALIAGTRITIDGSKELDFSFRRKLNKLWIIN